MTKAHKRSDTSFTPSTLYQLSLDLVVQNLHHGNIFLPTIPNLIRTDIKMRHAIEKVKSTLIRFLDELDIMKNAAELFRHAILSYESENVFNAILESNMLNDNDELKLQVEKCEDLIQFISLPNIEQLFDLSSYLHENCLILLKEFERTNSNIVNQVSKADSINSILICTIEEANAANRTLTKKFENYCNVIDMLRITCYKHDMTRASNYVGERLELLKSLANFINDKNCTMSTEDTNPFVSIAFDPFILLLNPSMD